MLKLQVIVVILYIASTQAASLTDRKTALLNELDSLLNNDVSGIPWKRDNPHAKTGLPWSDNKQALINDLADFVGKGKERKIVSEDSTSTAWKKVVDSLRNFVKVAKKDHVQSAEKRMAPPVEKVGNKGYLARNRQALGRGGDNLAENNENSSSMSSKKRTLLHEIQNMLNGALRKNTRQEKTNRQRPSHAEMQWRKSDNQQNQNHVYKRLLDDLNELFVTGNGNENKREAFQDSRLKGLNDDLAELVQSTTKN